MFAEIDKLILKLMRMQGTHNNQKNLEKEQKWQTHSSWFQNITKLQ